MQITKTLSSLLAIPLLLLVKFYQIFISPMLGQNCRFHPTCSCYAHEALAKHGAFKGSALAIKRIVKCQPMHPGGFDYVPEPKDKQKQNQCSVITEDVNQIITKTRPNLVKEKSTVTN